MAAVAKSGTPSISTINPPNNTKLAGLLAGEAIAAGDLCYVKSDGKVWKANGTSANAAARHAGVAATSAPVGEAVTLYHDVDFRYGASLTPGALVYLSTTAGLLEDAATTGGANAAGYCVDDTRIRFWEWRS